MIDPNEVADYLGVPLDDRITSCSEAASAWVEKRRSMTDPAELWLAPDVNLGGVIYASLLYTTRSQPQGHAGFDQLGLYGEEVGLAMSNVYRLVGSDAVVA